MNAVKHGLTAMHWLNRSERDHYQKLLENLVEEYGPHTPTEIMLVERVANIATRIMRIQ